MTRLDASRPYFIYRCYDTDSNLLYVGTSKNVGRRMAEHELVAAWHPYCASVRVDGPWDSGRALELEARLIRRMQPIFNVDWNDNARGAAYLAARDPDKAAALQVACRSAIDGLALPVAVTSP